MRELGPTFYYSPDDRASGPGRDRLTSGPNQVEIGTSLYTLSEEAQRLLKRGVTSGYEHTRSVVVLNEPHEYVDGQFNLFKGLEVFFQDNPSLVGKTIFLAEGTPANQPISVQSLIQEEPNPSDDLIRQVLSSFLITGYTAYEWKHQQGIPIIGTEDKLLYKMSRQFAALCTKEPAMLFETLKYKDGTEFPIPLGWAWLFAITARNKRLAQTLTEKTNEYENPMLFVGSTHLAKIEDNVFQLIKDRMIDIGHMGPFGMLQYPPEIFGGYPLYLSVENDSENLGIHHYLERAKIGYTFFGSVERGVVGNEDTYAQLLTVQGKNAFAANKDYREYLEWFVSQKRQGTTVESNPEAAAELVRRLKALKKEQEDRPSEPQQGGIFDSGLRENTESNFGKTDIEDAHQTQVYPDNYRASRDADGPWHWTNQNLKEKDGKTEHIPPEDVKE